MLDIVMQAQYNCNASYKKVSQTKEDGRNPERDKFS